MPFPPTQDTELEFRAVSCWYPVFIRTVFLSGANQERLSRLKDYYEGESMSTRHSGLRSDSGSTIFGQVNAELGVWTVDCVAYISCQIS